MTVDIGTNKIGAGVVLGEMFYFDGFSFSIFEMILIFGRANNFGSIGLPCFISI